MVNLKKIIYMDQPKGFITNDNKGKVWLLKKSLYILKQSPRQSYKCFDDFILRINFSRCSYDSCVYIEKEGSVMLTANSSVNETQNIKAMLSYKNSWNGISRNRHERTLFLSQKSYINKVLWIWYG